MTSSSESLSSIIPNFKPISVPEEFYTWDVDVRSFLERKSALWTIEEPDRPLPTAQSIREQYQEFGVQNATVNVAAIYQAHKDHNTEYNTANAFLSKAVDATQQSIISHARTPFEKYQAIVLRFRKRNPRTVMDILFKLIDFKPNANDLGPFFEVVKQTADKLATMNADPIITANALCQGIMYHHLAPVHSSFAGFVLQQQDAWTAENTDVVSAVRLMTQYAENVLVKPSETAMNAQLPIGRPPSKRQRSQTQQDGSHSNTTPRYSGPGCTNPKCIEHKITAHDPKNCFFEDPSKAPENWRRKYTPDWKPSA